MNYTDDNSIINRYIRALYEIAKTRNIIKKISEQLQELKKCIIALDNHKELLKRASIMKNFGIEFVNLLEEQLKLVPELKNFLHVLRVNHRLQLIIDLCDGFEKFQEELNGKKYFYVSTAKSMSAVTQKKLVDQLQSIFGGKIELILHKDPSILGGIIIRYRSKMLDYSVKSRIMRLHSAIKGESYEN